MNLFDKDKDKDKDKKNGQPGADGQQQQPPVEAKEEKPAFVFTGPTIKLKAGPFKGKTFEKGKEYAEFPPELAWRMKAVKKAK